LTGAAPASATRRSTCGRSFERISDAGQQERARSVWADAWRRQVHGCDPARAVELIEPVAQLCAATAYQHVLDHIEQTEQPYHALDPDERL